MKNVKKTVPVIASAFISLCFLVGCAESVVVTTDELIRDLDVSPTQSATYEQYSKKAIEDYFAVADGHVVGGETDYENEEVIAAASEAAAKLFAYACYNERTLDQYVFFAAQEGTTDISAGSAHAMKQEYYLRINETEKSCGYRYHYTIKYADCTGALSMFRDLFQSEDAYYRRNRPAVPSRRLEHKKGRKERRFRGRDAGMRLGNGQGLGRSRDRDD